MKKVFIDTNVILDFILHREHWAEAKDVVAHFVENRTEMMMSVGGFYRGFCRLSTWPSTTTHRYCVEWATLSTPTWRTRASISSP